MKLRTFLDRIRSDFFLSDRVGEYESILKAAISKGYSILSHSEYYNLVLNGTHVDKKIIIIRQDIDSDPKYVRQWLKVQKKYGVHSSIYFRKCTFDVDIMNEVYFSGSDCGYHYEELADFAKRNKLTKKEEVMKEFPKIRQEFKENLTKLTSKLGFKILYIASHGDFANRKLDLPNHRFISAELMEDCGLLFEAYQSEFVDTYSINISDCGYPTFYKGNTTVNQAIEANVPIIHFLMHPKHWRSSWYWNIYENGKRLIEGLQFK